MNSRPCHASYAYRVVRLAVAAGHFLASGSHACLADAQDVDSLATSVHASELVSADEAARLEEAFNDASAAGRSLFLRFTGGSTRGRSSETRAPRLKTQVRIPLGERAEAALSMERDPGEPMLWKPSQGWYGADHVAGYVSYDRESPVYDLSVVVGRYRATFGHGALMGSGSRPIRSAGRAGVSPKLRADVRGYAGYSERPAPAGIVSAFEHVSGFGFGALVSRERLTASLGRNPDGSVAVRDVSTSGLHVGPSALSRRGQVKHSLTGGWAAFRSKPISVGVLAGRTTISSPLLLSEAIRRTAGRVVSVAGSIGLGSCELSGEAVLSPGVLTEVVGRCSTEAGSVFSEWSREGSGPASLHGRAGRLIQDGPTVDVMSAGWHRRLVFRDRPLQGRLAVTGTMTRSRRPNSSANPSGRLRVHIQAEHEPFEVSVSLKVQRRSRDIESPLRLYGESASSGSILTTFEERSAGFGSTVGVEIVPGAFVRFGHLRSGASGVTGDQARSPGRRVAGTSVSLDIERRLVELAMGVLSVDASECYSEECSQLTSPRVYVYERGVQNAFGLASAGDDGIRWVLSAALAPDGRVTLEAQVRHRSDYHAELDERRAARIGAPPAATTYTVQLTIR